MNNIIGRASETQLFASVLKRSQAQLLAVYGRRRVGKTFLVRRFFEKRAHVMFIATGQRNGDKTRQLDKFRREFERTFRNGNDIPPFTSWDTALDQLATELQTIAKTAKGKKLVVFLDELPWLATPRSGLLDELDYIWNTRLQYVPNLCVIVCGSATSWMLDKVINAKGGLHNRIARSLKLNPFTVAETRDFLRSRGIRLDAKQVIKLYMATGGIPYYLDFAEPGRSATQIIAEMYFQEGQGLYGEFSRLFSSLFASSEEHARIVTALSRSRSGLYLKEISQATQLSVGGRLRKWLGELEACGFVASRTPYQHKRRATRYVLVDEYLWFYFCWIEKAPKLVFKRGGIDYWHEKSQSPAYASWAGLAFEMLCMRHIPEIKAALGLTGIRCEYSSWHHQPRNKKDTGAQIDLLFDRADGIITLCEIKHTDAPFRMTKADAGALKQRQDVFESHFGTRKQIDWALISTAGLDENTWSKDLVTRVVTGEDLFR